MPYILILVKYRRAIFYKMKTKHIYILTLVLVFSSCTNDNNRYKYHPSDENFISSENIDHIISTYSENESIDLLEDANNLKNRYLNKSLVKEFGVIQGDQNQIFSSIDQVLIYENKVLVLDGNRRDIAIFDIDGSLIRRVGQRGRGPGDLFQPGGMALGGNKLYISDSDYTIKSLDLNTTDSLYVFKSINRIPTGICISNTNIIIRSLTLEEDKNLFDVINYNTGDNVNSLGEFYNSDYTLVQTMLSDGIFACDPESNSIIFTKQILPYIYSYSMDGEKNWIAKFDSFIPLTHRETENSISFRWDASEFNYDHYETLNLYQENILLQVKRVNSKVTEEIAQNEDVHLASYLIDVKSGDGMHLGNDMEKILYINENYIVTENNEMYPGFHIHRY